MLRQRRLCESADDDDDDYDDDGGAEDMEWSGDEESSAASIQPRTKDGLAPRWWANETPDNGKADYLCNVPSVVMMTKILMVFVTEFSDLLIRDPGKGGIKGWFLFVNNHLE